MNRGRPRIRRKDVAAVRPKIRRDPVFKIKGRGPHPEPPDVESIDEMLHGVDSDLRNEYRNAVSVCH